MIKGMKVLAVIPARGGSKGLPGKNIRELAGKPLIAWTIEAAQASGFVDRLILSSDDDEIIGVAKQWGCEVPYVRPSELATDESTTADVVLDVLHRIPGFDWVVVLQPTSPLRTAEDIDGCLSDCVSHGACLGVSVCETVVSPYWMFGRSENGQLQTLIDMSEGASRRQDLPKTYQLNGAVYVARTSTFLEGKSFFGPKTYSYVMPLSRSVDIDDQIDMLFADCLLKSN